MFKIAYNYAMTTWVRLQANSIYHALSDATPNMI